MTENHASGCVHLRRRNFAHRPSVADLDRLAGAEAEGHHDQNVSHRGAIMKISAEFHKLQCQTISALERERLPFWNLWRELADFYLPKRYVWLQSDKERRVRNAKNPNILDGTGTKCARVLAAGMMNGITSPSRPWFSLRIPGFTEDPNSEARLWCDEVARRIMQVMAETNYYNAMAVLYLDLVVFGSAALLIYEDDDNIFRCYNPALGEFYLGQDYRLAVNTFGRKFTMTVHQLVTRFGEANVSDTVREAWKRGGDGLSQPFDVYHLIEPNNDGKSSVNKSFAFRDTYWEASKSDGTVLDQRGFHELPGIFPRWELTANDAYGTSPAMDALPDVIQLQHETKRKAQGLDKMVSPPMLAFRSTRSTVASIPGFASMAAHSLSRSSSLMVPVSSPCFPELPRKMSPNLGLSTAVNP